MKKILHKTGLTTLRIITRVAAANISVSCLAFSFIVGLMVVTSDTLNWESKFCGRMLDERQTSYAPLHDDQTGWPFCLSLMIVVKGKDTSCNQYMNYRMVQKSKTDFSMFFKSLKFKELQIKVLYFFIYILFSVYVILRYNLFIFK